MKDRIGKDRNGYHWTVGYNESNENIISVYRNNKFFGEHPSNDCFRVGSVLHITTLVQWGPGIVLQLEADSDRCQIHWQKLNIKKWHNTKTLLHYLKRDAILNEIGLADEDINLVNRSFIVERNE